MTTPPPRWWTVALVGGDRYEPVEVAPGAKAYPSAEEADAVAVAYRTAREFRAARERVISAAGEPL